jgi:hypothetical protein
MTVSISAKGGVAVITIDVGSKAMVAADLEI